MDPAAMVAAMSMLVLEGWQHRLAPDVSIFYSIEAALGKVREDARMRAQKSTKNYLFTTFREISIRFIHLFIRLCSLFTLLVLTVHNFMFFFLSL